jgi:hypothetical protein
MKVIDITQSPLSLVRSLDFQSSNSNGSSDSGRTTAIVGSVVAVVVLVMIGVAVAFFVLRSRSPETDVDSEFLAEPIDMNEDDRLSRFDPEAMAIDNWEVE